jgi:hypothetical protein
MIDLQALSLAIGGFEMQSEERVLFNNLKPNISVAIKETCTSDDEVIYKIADQVEKINTVTVEPGVEIAKSLSTIIDASIKDSVRVGCNLSIIAQGVLIGAFRSRSMQLEAHKTIRLLIQEIVGAVLKYKGDIKKAVDGLLDGIVIIAKEHQLNVDEAVIIVNESLTEMLDQKE